VCAIVVVDAVDVVEVDVVDIVLFDVVMWVEEIWVFGFVFFRCDIVGYCDEE
jgi:hypothetical protein